MGTIEPDYSFAREGISLRDWLWKLVSAELREQEKAGDVLFAMRYGVPSVNTDWDDLTESPRDEHQNCFEQKLKEVISEPGFKTQEFLNELVKNGITDHVFHGCVCDLVFEVLDEEFLEAPSALEKLLRNEDDEPRNHGLRIVSLLGIRGRAFIPVIMESLYRLSDSTEPPYARFGFDASSALGAIGQDDPEFVQEIIQLLYHEKYTVRAAAVQITEYLGPNVCGHEGKIISRLMELYYRQEYFGVIRAIASVGRDQEDIRKLIIEISQPRIPITKRDNLYPGANDFIVDDERGYALTAMQYFTDYSEEAIPALLGSLDTFEDTNPDMYDGGSYARICYTLQEFGTKAEAAVLPLANRLNQGEVCFDDAMFETLIAIGPAAKQAFPALEEYRSKWYEDETMPDLHSQIISDRYDDPAGWTMQQILKQQS